MSSNIHKLLIYDVTSSIVGRKQLVNTIKGHSPLVTISDAEYNEYKHKYIVVTYDSEHRDLTIQGYFDHPNMLNVRDKVSFKNSLLGNNIPSYRYIVNWLEVVDPALLEKPVTEPKPESESYNVF